MGDKETETVVKEAVNSAIHYAFYVGDKDEAFYKHVGHTLSAIFVDNGYKNVVDYKTPDCLDSKMVELYGYWNEVEKASKLLSKEQFRKIASSNKHSEYFDDYYIEQAVELKEKL